MFVINDDLSIYITRGDTAFFRLSAMKDDTEKYKFQPGDVVRIKVFEKKSCDNVVMQKLFGIEAETDTVDMMLDENDTKIGDVISKPTDYWYEIELNPFTNPQTIIGYDDDGAKVFKLFPEGDDVEDTPIEPEDIPIVDEELDVTSTRPVQNQAIARAILVMQSGVNQAIEAVETFDERLTNAEEATADAIGRSDVVDNLLSESADLPLSARQGRVLSENMGGLKMVAVTQEEYDAMSTKDDFTVYFIRESI